MQRLFIPGIFFLALLTPSCTKQISGVDPATPATVTNGLTPTPINCMYSPVVAGKVLAPHPRNYMMTASSGNDIAFFGGQSLSTPNFYGVDIYNVVTGTWSSKAFDNNQYAAIAGCNNYIAIGGGWATDAIVGINTVHMLNTTTNQWSDAYLSVPRFALAAAGYGNKLLFAGGINDAGTVIMYSRVDIFDAASNSWSTAELSAPREDLTGAAANNIIAFAGGKYTEAVKTVDFYNIITGQWSHSALSKARNGISGIGSGNLLFFAGGYDENNNKSDICDIYNTVTGTWSVAHMANSKGSNLLVATLGSKVIFYNSTSKIADVYSTCSNTWGTMKLTIDPYLCTAGTAGGKLLMGRNDLVEYKEGLFTVN